MKNIICSIFIFLTFCTANSQDSGIRFFEGTLAEAQTKAATEKKLIFMDCFTTWCGPCKMLDAQTFSKPEVGEYFNSNFICVKKDMEKGEGKDIAKKYKVSAFLRRCSRAMPIATSTDRDGSSCCFAASSW